MDPRWVTEKRRDMFAVILYSLVGLIIVTALVTLTNYAAYSNTLHR
jgi:hypothetical protein